MGSTKSVMRVSPRGVLTIENRPGGIRKPRSDADDFDLSMEPPSAVQEQIGAIRLSCPLKPYTERGLVKLELSGKEAFLFDELNFCGDGGDGSCIHGINCATGYMHTLEIYIHSGKAWKKVFASNVSTPVYR